MEIGQAMLLLARAAKRAGLSGEINEVVRTGLLHVLAGERAPAWVSPEEADLVADWAAAVRASGGDFVGAAYQEMLRREVISTHNGLLVRGAPGQHRRTGAYYTGDTVVRYMVSRAQTLQPGASSLIDPACGVGAFLQAASEAYRGRLTRIAGWDVDPVALAVSHTRLPEGEFAVQDALLSESEGQYDLCLGNPPYISSGLRGAVAHHPDRLRALRLRYPGSAEYKVNTYPLFIERALELLRPGGVLGFIVPDSFLTGRYFTGLRRLLLHHTLLELTLIQEDFWAHGRVGQSVILFVRKEHPEPGQRVRIRLCARPQDLEQDGWEEVPIAEVVWGPLERFRLVRGASARRALQQMERSARPVSDWLRTYSGLIGRQGQASLVCPGDSLGECTADMGRLLRSGREIDRYLLHWEGARVCLDPGLIKSGGNRAYYEQPKILLRQTADSLRAVYDDRGYFCLNNIHLLVPARKDANLRALLGVLNAEPFSRYYQAVTMEAGRLYAQVDLDILGSLPMPTLEAPDIAHLEGLVRERENAAPDRAALLDRAIDVAVEQLYGLRQR